MTQENKRNPFDRLNFSGEIEPVIDRLALAYGIGKPRSFSPIGIGYEDCNVIVETGKGKYVAKMFEKERTSEDIANYGQMMEKVMEAGVTHPRILRSQDGEIIYSDSEAKGISLILMEFIEGKTYFELGSPTDDDLSKIAEQAARINRIDYQPSRVVDSWSIPRIHEMFERVREFIQPEDLRFVRRAIELYDQIPIDNLPMAFVHGDFTKGNVLKSENGDIYVLDFSVAFWYPRIQELGVFSASLMHNLGVRRSLRERTEQIASEYNRFNPLVSKEREYLYDYALADYVAKFMGVHQEKFINGDDNAENRLWFDLGREGLRKELT